MIHSLQNTHNYIELDTNKFFNKIKTHHLKRQESSIIVSAVTIQFADGYITAIWKHDLKPNN